jgi:DNA polymerase-3 subunit gamma/tau
MMLPTGNDAALVSRVEKLERSLAIGISTISEPKVAKSVPVVEEVKQVPKAESKTVAVAKIEPVKTESKGTNHKPSGQADIASLRRMWPQVIENVKGKRRLTWSLLATSAQILSVDGESISIGIVNAGARDSFVRSESDVILSDSSVATTTMARVDEDPADANMLSGADLLASKLGAKVIKESN